MYLMTRLTLNNISHHRCIEPDFFENVQSAVSTLMTRLSWNTDVVADQTIRMLKSKRMPPELVIGMDGKFVFGVARMLPAWVHDWFNWILLMTLPKPDIISNKKEGWK